MLGRWQRTRKGTVSWHCRVALPDPGTSPREKKFGVRSSLAPPQRLRAVLPCAAWDVTLRRLATTTSRLDTEGGNRGVTCQSHPRCQPCSQDSGFLKKGLALLDSKSNLHAGVPSRKDTSFITNPPHPSYPVHLVTSPLRSRHDSCKLVPNFHAIWWNYGGVCCGFVFFSYSFQRCYRWFFLAWCCHHPVSLLRRWRRRQRCFLARSKCWNNPFTHLCSAGSISSAQNTLERCKQSLATPQPCWEGWGTWCLEKILWQHNLLDSAFKNKKSPRGTDGAQHSCYLKLSKIKSWRLQAQCKRQWLLRTLVKAPWGGKAH